MSVWRRPCARTVAENHWPANGGSAREGAAFSALMPCRFDETFEVAAAELTFGLQVSDDGLDRSLRCTIESRPAAKENLQMKLQGLEFSSSQSPRIRKTDSHSSAYRLVHGRRSRIPYM